MPRFGNAEIVLDGVVRDRAPVEFVGIFCARVIDRMRGTRGSLADFELHPTNSYRDKSHAFSVIHFLDDILALIAITIDGLPPPSWPALCRPSTPSGSAIDSPVRIAPYSQSLRVGYNGVLVDGRVKPGHDGLSRPRINKTTAIAIRADIFLRKSRTWFRLA
jgi:hypothetical protein